MVADESGTGQPPAQFPTPPPKPQATGLRRFLYVCAGLGCVGMAYLGAVLPGLPTTPWVLAASFFFSRSSPRLNRWLRRSPLFGRLLRDWDDHGGIRRPVKIFAVCLVVTVVTLSLTFRALPLWLKWVIGCCALVGICTIVFVVPTVRG
ncbi:MAG: YbaN family protein, partial [Gemmataceae bacterium]|nr:YbaN family protein [Gemmataceae bacterium]